jgi:diguanylate cyclase (GGDEF)-like protein
MSEIEKFRQQYPQYNDISDEEIAENLHKTFYSDIPKDQFRRKLGIDAVPQYAEDKTTTPELESTAKAKEEKSDPFKPEQKPLTFLGQSSAMNINENTPENKRGFINNALRLAYDRGSELTGRAVRGLIGRPGASLEDKFGLGTIVWEKDFKDVDNDGTRLRIRYLNPTEFKEYSKSRNVENLVEDTIPNTLIDADFGGEERATTQDIKDAYNEGDVLGTAGAVVKFAAEQGIKSIPDMVALASGVPAISAYIGARSDEIGEARAENKNMEEQGMREQLEALPAAMGSALFDKFGLQYMTRTFGKAAPADIGAEIIKSGYKNAAKRIGKESGKAAAVEGATEAFQEGVIEYLGEKLGTDAPLSFDEALERGFFGSLAGGVIGGTVSGTGQTLQELTRTNINIEDGDLDRIQEEMTTEPQMMKNVSRETGQGNGEKYFDDRLNKDIFRVNLSSMIDGLVSSNEETNDKAPINMGNEQLTHKQAARAVAKALSGQKMGVKQKRFVSAALDQITDKETYSDPDMDPAAAEILDAQKVRKKARAKAAEEIGAISPEIPATGQLYSENEYHSEMDAEARIAYEISSNLDQMGYQDQVSDILSKSSTTADAIYELEKLYAKQTNQPDQASPKPETQPSSPERREASQNVDNDSRTGERRNQSSRAAFESLSLDEQYDLAYTSELTGLPNARAFEEDLETSPFVASIDADGLSGVNDNLGHNAGDAMLKAVAEALKNTDAQVYHKSGDEFYILGDSQAEVEQAVREATQELKHMVVESEAGKLQGIEITSGISRSKEAADAAMEKQKKVREAAGLRSPKGVLPPSGVMYSKVPEVQSGNISSDPDVKYSAAGAPGRKHKGLIGKNQELPVDPNADYTFLDGRQIRIPKEPIQRAHIIKEFTRKLGVNIHTGRIKRKGVLGFYRDGMGETRLKNANDMEVAAHEVAHYLDNRYPWIKNLYQQYGSEIRDVSYDKNLDYEGFAEFVRLWMTEEHEAAQRAPSFFDAWERALNQRGREKLKAALKDTQMLMHAYYNQGSLARLQSKIGHRVTFKEKIKDRMHKMGDRILQNVFDDLRTFKQIERKIRGELADATASAYKSFRLARGINGVMEAVVESATINWNSNGDLEKTGKGLRQVFEPVYDKMDLMEAYMVARRAQELMAQGRENLIRPDEMREGLKLAEKYPEFEEVFDEYQEWNQRMMDFYEASGIINPETRASIEEVNKNYVPFNRIVETLEGNKPPSGSSSPFMRLKGGTQNINDVFESIVGNTTQLVRMSMANRSKQLFYDMMKRDQSQTAGQYAAQIPKDVKPVSISRDQVLRKVLDSMGMTMAWYRQASEMPKNQAEADLIEMIDESLPAAEAFVTFFQYGQDPKGNIDYVMRDGEKEFWEVSNSPEGRLLWDSINAIGPRGHNLVLGFLGGFSSTLRRGVTWTPRFQISNWIRDTLNSFTMSKGQMVPVLSPAKALAERFINDEHYMEFIINGGGFSAMAEADGINRDKVVVPGSPAHKNLWRAVKNLGYKYDNVLSSVEYSNRIAEYKSLVASGVSKREAAYAGREISTDFAMRGSNDVLRYITTGVPFMNARIEGLYRLAREIGELPPEERGPKLAATSFNFALRGMMALTLPTLALYMLNKDDERYQEMPDWQRDLYWVIFTGSGEDDYFFIPKPFEVGTIFATIPERSVEYMYKNDEKELADAMLWMVMNTFSMDPVPQAFKPFRDLQLNKNFTGAPIVPTFMALNGVEPSEEYRYYTSDAMIALGRKFNISPIKAEYLVKGYFGTLGSWALGAADYMVGDINNTGENPTKTWEDNVLISNLVNSGPLRRTKSSEMFYDTLKETRKVVNTMRDMKKRSPDRLEGYINTPEKQAMIGLNKQLESIYREMSKLRKAQDLIRRDNSMSGDDKRRDINDLQRQINALARSQRENINSEAVKELIKEVERQNAQ